MSTTRLRRIAVLTAGLALTTAATAFAAERAVIPVTNAEELARALAQAQPGDTVELAPGNYEGTFFTTASGTGSAPITLTGPADAVLSNTQNGCDPNVPDGRDVSYCGYGLHLNGADHWRLQGFTVERSAKGIVLDRSNHNVIDGVEVREIADEGVHFRAASSDNVIQNSYVHNTGTEQPQYGEGLYFGSAESNWDKYGDTPGQPDRSDRNRALDNRLGPDVRAEHVDIKEGTADGEVLRNSFDGQGMTGQNSAESWVSAKGNGYQISANRGVKSFEHGFKVIQRVDGWGCRNVFHDNHADVQAAGYGFQLPHDERCGAERNEVYRDNTVVNAGSGFSDVEPIG
ncbi:right-handed parallel beta-helix repeat-containing protein [Saccharopolyspora hirsuta]|uniref:right-handed parallel beta-helix repeat-containing protein n=1 Tax=Saccharopolyspora hirsuta TaxID=1837 RepID=UPI0033207E1F